jgi:hypothetical protein
VSFMPRSPHTVPWQDGAAFVTALSNSLTMAGCCHPMLSRSVPQEQLPDGFV